MSFWPAIVGIGMVGVTGLIVNLWQRWKLAKAESRADKAEAQNTTLTGELRDFHAAAAAETLRQKGTLDVLRTAHDALIRGDADLARGHLDVAGDYLRDSLRSAAAPAPGPGPHPEVPRQPPAPDAPGSPGRVR